MSGEGPTPDGCPTCGALPCDWVNVPGWQPIASAPRDGTDILVCMTHNLPDGEWETLQWVDWTLDGEQWPIWRNRIDLPYSPTHWMPLPAAPVIS